MRYNDDQSSPRLRSAIALAVAALVLVVGAQWDLLWLDRPAAHAPHSVAAAPAAEFAVIYDHSHLQDGSTPTSPDSVTAAVLPRVSTLLIALGLMIAVVVFGRSFGQAALAVMRGPPRASAGVLTGQSIISRFCIARR